MRRILEALQNVNGVFATLVVNGTGQLLGHVADAIFDHDTMLEVATATTRLITACELHHDDWKGMDGAFSDGHLFVRRIDEEHSLTIVTAREFDRAFLSISARVTAKKLKKALAEGATMSAPPPPPASGSQPGSNSHHSMGSGISGAAVGSGIVWPKGSAKGVLVADEQMQAFLDKCVQALAFSVGPAASVLVKKSVRAITEGTVLTRDQKATLLAALEGHIPYDEERAAFRAKVKNA